MLKLMLVEDGRVLAELPLSTRGWRRDDLRRELDSLDGDLERFSSLFDILSNAGRVRMMSALFEESERPLAFTELMNELEMNPKLVSESARKLRNAGLIEKDVNGRYRTTREGEAQFLMVGIALRRMLQILEEM
jgi:DNA-binding transcriptional ArsR family regulator